MKKIFTFFVLTFVYGVACSQTPDWLWAIAPTAGGCLTEGYGLAVSPTGYFYMSGRFGGTMTLGGQSATASSSEVYSGKFNSTGTFSWLVNHPQTGDYNYALAVDNLSNSYVTGTQASNNNGYLDKYDSTGARIWNLQLTGINGYAITTDKNQNVYLAGMLFTSANFGSGTINSAGNTDMFVAKFNSAGVCQWARSGGGAGYDLAKSVAVDAEGNVYVAGYYNGTATFGTITPPAASGYSNIFIAKYDSLGTIQRVTYATNAGLGTSWTYWADVGMTIDSCANIYVTSQFVNTAKFDNLSVTSRGYEDIFVAKCSSAGKWQWVKSAGGKSSVGGTYIGGEGGFNVALDKHNDVVISGSFVDTAYFDNQMIVNTTHLSPFVANYSNSTGDLQWVTGVTGTAWGFPRGMAIDKDGFIYITGDLGGGSTPGTDVFGSTTVSNAASCTNLSLFIAKLDTVPVKNITFHPDSFYCAGISDSLAFTITGIFNNGNIFTAELSDSTGSFASPVNLGTYNSTTAGNIPITIPANTPSGSKYVIRISSSNPAVSSHYYCYGSALSPVYITIGSSANLKVTPDTTACAGTSLQLNASGGNSYTWFPNTNLSCTNCANPIATPVSAQTYTVIANPGSTCTAQKTVVVGVAPAINLTVSNNTSICSGSSTPLTVSGGTTYSWLPVASLSCTNCANPMASPIISTTYTVTGSNGTCSNSKTVVVEVGNVAVAGQITAVRDTICAGTPGNLILSGNSSDVIQWQSATTPGSYSNTGPDTSRFKTNPLSQSTYYRAIVGSGNCIDTTLSFVLFVPPVLAANFNYTESGTTVTFKDSSFGSIISYNWDFGDGTTSKDKNPAHPYPNVDSTYYVCLTIYDGSNCSYTFCRYVSVVTGIAVVSAEGKWVAYPNPFTDELVIDSKTHNDKMESVEIYDVLGRSVLNDFTPGATMSSLRIDVSPLAEGIYFLEIKTSEADYLQKVIKQ